MDPFSVFISALFAMTLLIVLAIATMWLCINDNKTQSSPHKYSSKSTYVDYDEYSYLDDRVIGLLHRYPGAEVRDITRMFSQMDDTITVYEILNSLDRCKRRGLVRQ